MPAGAWERGPATTLPPARTEGSYTVALVCLGNICRSPMAHVVVEERLADLGLGAPVGPVTVVSSGTGGWHVGDPMDPRAAATLGAAGYDATRHRARQHDATAAVDLVLAMDSSNRADLADLGTDAARLALFGDLDPLTPGADVPDPYYGGEQGFADVLAMVERTADALVARLTAERPWLPAGSTG